MAAPLQSQRTRRLQSLMETLSDELTPIARHRTDPVESAKLLWGSICGPVLARHCEPLGFEEGLLIVGARGRDWREALYVRRHELRRRLRAAIPGMRGIRLVNLPPAGPAPPPAPPMAPRPADPRTSDIGHPRLRDALDGLLVAFEHRKVARTGESS